MDARQKITKIMDHAMKLKVPIIGINDSGVPAFRKVSTLWQVTAKFSIATHKPQALFPKFL